MTYEVVLSNPYPHEFPLEPLKRVVLFHLTQHMYLLQTRAELFESQLKLTQDYNVIVNCSIIFPCLKNVFHL